MAENEFTELESRLADYGDVLRGALAAARADEPAVPNEADVADVIPLPSADRGKHRPRRKRAAAVVGVAAALVATIALAAPRAAQEDERPGGELADAPVLAEVAGASSSGFDAVDGMSTTTDSDGDVPGLAAFVDSEADASGTPLSDAELERRAAFLDGLSASAVDSTGAPAGDDSASGGDELDSGSAAASAACEAADDQRVVERDGQCWLVGPAPTRSGNGCPDDAIAVGDECYVEVDARCHETRAIADGCLGPVVDDRGAVEYVPARATCSIGVLVGDRCLSEEDRIGDSSCPGGLVEIGDGCYQIVDPESSCGEYQLVDGACWKPVPGDEVPTCPSGFEQAGTLCYRYEEAAVSCASGQLVGGPRCKIFEDAVPGPESCGSYLQDGSGCYIVVDPDPDGGCGELPPAGDGCRYPKPSRPSWTCGGDVVPEPSCIRYEDAAVVCSIGRLVDGGRCKIESDPHWEFRCPPNAVLSGNACGKFVDPTVGCGNLDVAPDGVRCKRWVRAVQASDRCPAGYEPAGDACKRWDEAEQRCPTGTFEYRNGAAMCRIEIDGPDACRGEGLVWFEGKCHQVVRPSCGDLEPSPWTEGKCKKSVRPVPVELTCAPGYRLVKELCLKPLARD